MRDNDYIMLGFVGVLGSFGFLCGFLQALLQGLQNGAWVYMVVYVVTVVPGIAAITIMIKRAIKSGVFKEERV